MEIALRPATLEDAPAISAIYSPYVLSSPATFETSPPDAAEMAQRVAKITAHFPWIVAEDSSGIVGYAYANLHRERPAYQWAVDVSVYVAEWAHRQGVGKQLYRRILPIVAGQGYYQAFAGITLPNEASVRLHQSVGFELIGIYKDIGYKLGSWHDTSWWQLRLREPDEAPAAPVSWQIP